MGGGLRGGRPLKCSVKLKKCVGWNGTDLTLSSEPLTPASRTLSPREREFHNILCRKKNALSPEGVAKRPLG